MQQIRLQDNHKNIQVIIGIVCLVGLFYGNTLKNGFIHDDHGQIEQNTYIQSFTYLPKVLTGCIWESAVGDCKKTFYYRPLQTLAYMMTYAVSPSPWIFHFVNLILFTMCIYLTYTMVLLLTKNPILSILTSCLFLIHPVNSEVVNWIAAVPELLYTMFMLLGTISFVLYRQTQRKKYIIGVYIWYLLGIFSKEPAVFLPFIFLLLDLIYFKIRPLHFIKTHVYIPYVISIIIFCVYMLLRFYVLGGLGIDPTMTVTIQERILMFFDLFYRYIKALFFPYPLNLYYPYRIPSDFMTNTVRVGFIAVFLMGFALTYAWKHTMRIIIFALVWYFVFIAPSLIFVTSIGENLFAERHVFASTIGFSIILSVILTHIWNMNPKGKTILILLVSTMLIVTYPIIYQRNTLWHDDERLYIHTLTISPDADLVRYNLALLYRDKGNFSLAKEQLEIILKKNTWIGLYKVLNNLGDIARKEQRFADAFEYFKKSIENNSSHMPAYNNLGALYFEQGNIVESVRTYCKANQIDPRYQIANANYDTIISRIKEMDTHSFSFMLSQIEETFKENKDITIVPKIGGCSKAPGCQLTFHLPYIKSDIILPFLIGGKTQSGTIIRPTQVTYSPINPTVELVIDQQFRNQQIILFIPLCGGTYYKTASM